MEIHKGKLGATINDWRFADPEGTADLEEVLKGRAAFGPPQQAGGTQAEVQTVPRAGLVHQGTTKDSPGV